LNRLREEKEMLGEKLAAAITARNAFAALIQAQRTALQADLEMAIWGLPFSKD